MIHDSVDLRKGKQGGKNISCFSFRWTLKVFLRFISLLFEVKDSDSGNESKIESQMKYENMDSERHNSRNGSRATQGISVRIPLSVYFFYVLPSTITTLLHFYFTYPYWLPILICRFQKIRDETTVREWTDAGKDLPQPFCILLHWSSAQYDHLILYSGQASSFLFHSLSLFPRFLFLYDVNKCIICEQLKERETGKRYTRDRLCCALAFGTKSLRQSKTQLNLHSKVW